MKPFAKLSKEEKKKEFPERLTTALAALLFIAAKESTNHRLDTLKDINKRLEEKRHKRKQHMLECHTYDSDEGYDSSCMGKDVSEDDRELMMKQLMQHQVRLCQVCQWEEDKTTKEPKIPLEHLMEHE